MSYQLGLLSNFELLTFLDYLYFRIYSVVKLTLRHITICVIEGGGGCVTVTHLFLRITSCVSTYRCDDAWLPSHDAPFIMLVVGFVVTWTLVLLLEVLTVAHAVSGTPCVDWLLMQKSAGDF